MLVMSVDDSPTMRRIISATLTLSGYEFIEAENGKDALFKLNALGQQKVNLFVVDINMPVMNGIEFVTELRKKNGLCKNAGYYPYDRVGKRDDR